MDVKRHHAPEVIDAIMTAWRAGASYGQAGKPFGYSKGVVAGIVSRNKNPGEMGARPFRPALGPRIKCLPPARKSPAAPMLPPARKAPAGDRRPKWMLSHRMVSGLHFRTCQWISGEPSADDRCKCRAAVGESRVYCPRHELRAWRRERAGEAA